MRCSVGCIVPSGIATDDTTKYFFQDLMQTRSLASLYDFENRAGLFPDVDSRMKFCLLTLTGAQRPAVHGAEFVFFAHSVDDLRDEQRRFTLAAEDLALLNPNTRTWPTSDATAGSLAGGTSPTPPMSALLSPVSCRVLR
jgi:hypothetical protein